jgi:hypothetical protein
LAVVLERHIHLSHRELSSCCEWLAETVLQTCGGLVKGRVVTEEGCLLRESSEELKEDGCV